MEDIMASFLNEAKKAGEKTYTNNINFFGISEGKNKYRFVPYNDMLYCRNTKHFTTHFGVMNRETKKGISVICTMNKHKQCPLCEEYSRAVQLDQGDAFKKAPQNFYNFYVINQEGKAGILEMDEMCFNQFGRYVQKCLEDEDYGKRNIMSLDAGSYIIIDLLIEKEGSKKKRTFSFTKIERPQLMTKEEVDKLFNGYPRLDSLKKEYSPEKLKMMLDTGRLDVLEDDKKEKNENSATSSMDRIKNAITSEEQQSKVIDDSINKNEDTPQQSMVDKLRAELEGDDDIP